MTSILLPKIDYNLHLGRRILAKGAGVRKKRKHDLHEERCQCNGNHACNLRVVFENFEKKKYTLVDIFCFEEQSSVILVIKLELQHSGLATAEVKSILGFFPYICCLFVAAIWFNVSSTD